MQQQPPHQQGLDLFSAALLSSNEETDQSLVSEEDTGHTTTTNRNEPIESARIKKKKSKGVGVMWIKASTSMAKIFLNKTNRRAMDIFRDLAIQMNREELSGLSYAEVISGLAKDTKLATRRARHISGDYLQLDNPAELAIVKNAHKYMKFSNATLGWGGLVALGLNNKNKAHPDAKHDVFDRKDAVVSHCNIPREDVHMFYFQEGDTMCPTHILASDEASKSLIIGVRGTMSVADALSDMRGTPYPLDRDGLKGVKCHAGFYEAAMGIWTNVYDKVLNLLKEERRQGWKLVCTGHSMGAGVSSILCVLLKQALKADRLIKTTSAGNYGKQDHVIPSERKWAMVPLVAGLPKDLDVEAWAFAPPPTFTDVDILDDDIVSSIRAFVNRDDIICRMSIGGARELARRIRVLAFVKRAGGFDKFMELSDEERIKLQMRPEDVETEESINDAAFTRDNSAMVGKQSKIKETTTQSQDGVTVYAAGGLDDDSMVFQHDEDRGNLAKISARGHGRHPDGRPTPDDVTKHVIVYKNATVAAENNNNTSANTITFEDLVRLEHLLPGRKRVEESKMFVPGLVYHMHSYPCETAEKFVKRKTIKPTPFIGLSKIGFKPKLPCEVCGSSMGLFTPRKTCKLCHTSVCAQCHKGYVQMPGKHWKDVNCCTKCEEHYLRSMRSNHWGMLRIERSSAALIDHGFVFNLQIFGQHFPNKYENALKLIIDSWKRCINIEEPSQIDQTSS